MFKTIILAYRGQYKGIYGVELDTYSTYLVKKKRALYVNKISKKNAKAIWGWWRLRHGTSDPRGF